MKNLNKKLIVLAIIIVGVIVAGAFMYLNLTGEKNLSAQAAGEKVINYINQNMLQGGLTASLIDVVEESGVYKFRLKIQDMEYTSYITKDGKLLFPDTYEVTEPEEVGTEPEAEVQGGEEESSYDQSQLEALAKCLTEKGAKFYGTYWCGYCNKEKELFGESVEYLPYVECSDEAQQLTVECKEAGISSFPTWEFGGEKSPGYKTIEQLTELSGCQL